MITRKLTGAVFLLSLSTFVAVRAQQPPAPAQQQVPPFGGLGPTEGFKTLSTAPGLEATLWASEPDLTNPTSLAIDERGRIWVTEGVNYRAQQPRPAGDRIVILEDTNGDGKADKAKTFDQHPDLRAPLGIAVLGNKVILSQAPDLIVYTKDADDRIVSKEVLLTGWKGINHDHGLHKVMFGPDGRLYFNTGNSGMDVTDRSGNHIVANPNTAPDPQHYFGGVPLRVNLDGTGLTALAQNFRNPYMLAIDSFGSMWQTDNDDDGNAWTRLSYIFEGGNYGFEGPGGRAWRNDDGTHFHNELPGVVPNVERLGPGAPTGILIYEGSLLPAKYRGHPLHAENSKRSVRAYLDTEDGAGYKVTIDDVLFSKTDPWFRPSDVAVAPDGAVYVTDWYDSLTGGHAMGDPRGEHGRVYRLAPPNHKSVVPKLDLATDAGISAAFGSPNQSVFFLAHEALKTRGVSALPLLDAAWKQRDPVVRARALWMLGALGAPGAAAVQAAAKDADARFRVLALRVMAANGREMVTASQPLLHDKSPQVRREIALLLQDRSRMTPAYVVGEPQPVSTALLNALVELTKQYDGKDRWYLEALGIAARGREDALFAQLREVYPGKFSASLASLTWEFRPKTAIPYLTAAMNDASLPAADRVKAMEALSVMQWPEAASAVEALLVSDSTPPALFAEAFPRYRHQLVSLWTASTKSQALPTIIRKALKTPVTQAKAVEAVAAANDPQYAPDLLALAKSSAAADDVRAAALNGAASARGAVAADLDALARSGPVVLRVAAVRGLGVINPPDVDARAQAILLSDVPNEVRSEAVRLLVRTAGGLNALLDLKESGKLTSDVENLARALVTTGNRGGGAGARAAGPGGRGATPPDPALVTARERAAKVFPTAAATTRALPNVNQLEKNYRADAEAGRKVFDWAAVNCSGCHSVGGPKKFGPDLSAIGSKYGKPAMLDQILNPSAAINPDYVPWTLQTAQGSVTGLITEQTPDRVVIKTSPQDDVRLKPSDITGKRQLAVSMMPDGLANLMTPQQVVDLLEYLMSLKAR